LVCVFSGVVGSLTLEIRTQVNELEGEPFDLSHIQHPRFAESNALPIARLRLSFSRRFDDGPDPFHVCGWSDTPAFSARPATVIRPARSYRVNYSGSHPRIVSLQRGITMAITTVRCARASTLLWPGLFGLLLGLLISSNDVHAFNPAEVMKVEEDWELVLNEPSADNVAPQVTCVISPAGDVEGVYAALELNHGSLPEFSAGGLQLQVWNGEDWLTVRDHAGSALHQTAEVVAWTQKMWLQGGKVHFKVDNGTSTSWGTFGANDNIKLSLSSSLSNLNGYNVALSASQSGIGYGSQRVQSLVLKRVRYYDAAGALLLEDTTPRSVHQQ
jgi:hypothetical protein